LEPELVTCCDSFKNGSLPSRVELVASLLMLQHEQIFWVGTEKGAPSAARIFQSQLSLNNFLNRRHVRQELLTSAQALAKG
jgi:hypothetical protein